MPGPPCSTSSGTAAPSPYVPVQTRPPGTSTIRSTGGGVMAVPFFDGDVGGHGSDRRPTLGQRHVLASPTTMWTTLITTPSPDRIGTRVRVTSARHGAGGPGWRTPRAAR